MGCIAGLLARQYAFYAQRLAQQEHWSSLGLDVVYDDDNALKTVIGVNNSFKGHESIKDWRLEPSVRQLLLHNTDLDDEKLQGVELLPQLEVLMLSASHITDESSSTIRKCKHVKTLNVAYTTVSDRSISDIARMPSLIKLDIYRSGITDSGISRLHEVRKQLNLPQVTIAPPPKSSFSIVPLNAPS